MTAVSHTKGVKLVLKLGDGASPEVFAAKCSINAERGITFTSTLSDTAIPDCTDPEALAIIAREKTDYSAAVNGAGLLNVGDELFFFNWLKSPDAKNCQVIVDSVGGTTFSGAFHLGEFSITGNRGGKIECSISLSSDGAVAGATNA